WRDAVADPSPLSPPSCRWPADGLPAAFLASGDQAPEHRPVGEAVARGQVGGVALHALPHRLARRHVEAGDLALAPDDGRELAVDRARDVNDDTGVVHSPVP